MMSRLHSPQGLSFQSANKSLANQREIALTTYNDPVTGNDTVRLAVRREDANPMVYTLPVTNLKETLEGLYRDIRSALNKISENQD